MTQDIGEFVEGLRRLLPVSWDNETDGHGEPTHAVLTFGDHQTQAMTLRPDDWMVLNEIPDTLQSLQRENDELREALRRTAAALNKMICCLGDKNTDGTHYRWSSMLSFEDGQEALEANNANAELLDRKVLSERGS